MRMPYFVQVDIVEPGAAHQEQGDSLFVEDIQGLGADVRADKGADGVEALRQGGCAGIQVGFRVLDGDVGEAFGFQGVLKGFFVIAFGVVEQDFHFDFLSFRIFQHLLSTLYHDMKIIPQFLASWRI